MENKITLPALSAMLAQRTGLTKRLCEDFVRELFALVSSSLVEGESVKINDLGTFRVAKVEPRMSVDVVTGEAIRIPGHRKVVFLPDKELAAVINAPFEAFEPIELPDDLPEELLDKVDAEERSELSEQPEKSEQSEQSERLEVLEQSEQLEVSEQSEQFELSEQSDNSTNSNSPDISDDSNNPYGPDCFYNLSDQEDSGEPQAEIPVESSVPEPQVPKSPIVGTPVPESSVPEPQIPEAPIVEPPVREVRIVERDSRRFSIGFLIGFLCCLIVFGVMVLIGYRTLLSKIESIQPVEIPEIVVADDGEREVSADATAEGGESGARNTPGSAQDNEAAAEGDNTAAAAGQSAAEGRKELEPATKPSDKKVYDTISRTRFLTTMAKEHYGNFNLWPYIYEENKAFLGHPDRIRPGTRVVVPPLSKYGVDPNSKADIEKARRKGAEIYARYR